MSLRPSKRRLGLSGPNDGGRPPPAESSLSTQGSLPGGNTRLPGAASACSSQTTGALACSTGTPTTPAVRQHDASKANHASREGPRCIALHDSSRCLARTGSIARADEACPGVTQQALVNRAAQEPYLGVGQEQATAIPVVEFRPSDNRRSDEKSGCSAPNSVFDLPTGFAETRDRIPYGPRGLRRNLLVRKAK
jgi:hypothetical protein